MSQASQAKAMQDYFQSLLNDVDIIGISPEIPVQPEPVRKAESVQPELEYAIAEPLVTTALVTTPERTQLLNQLLSTVSVPAISEELVSVEVPVESKSEPLVPVWQNISPEKEFPALFFTISGITFAVPLTDLGGIHQLQKVTPLFGKPEWFAGVMTHRDTQLNAVDGTRWFMPNQINSEDYQYLVMLGETQWGIECHKLIGTETLHYDQIKWRDKPGKRPWLAGMVKEKMCALLHVQELLTLLQQGVNIDGQ
jgi:purine-binding chemotaxis protein CheW